MLFYKQRATWEPLRSIDSATFTGSFQAVGTPLAFPSFICKMVNNSDRLVTVSINGTTAIDVCPAGSFWLYDEYDSLPAGTQIFVSGLAGGTGLVYLATQYHVTN